MKKDNERLQVKKVPIFNAEKTDLSEYLKDMFIYCVELHNEIKDFGFNNEEAKTFFQYMVRNSSEIQYKVIRKIKFTEALLEDGKDLNDLAGTDVSEIFSLIEELKTYLNSLKQITYKNLRIRAISEAYYMDGLSIKDIVKTLMDAKILNHDDEDHHFRKISRFVEEFKEHDVIVKPSTH